MYKFYIQKADKNANAVGSPIDIETAFPGVHYLRMEGLETQGRIKNVYSETFPDESGDRIYLPSDDDHEPAFASTTLTLTILVEGEERRARFHDIREVLSSGRFFWWDTARHLKAYCVMTEQQTVTEDILKGMKYIQATFTLTNLWGIGKPCDDSGNLL